MFRTGGWLVGIPPNYLEVITQGPDRMCQCVIFFFSVRLDHVFWTTLRIHVYYIRLTPAVRSLLPEMSGLSVNFES